MRKKVVSKARPKSLRPKGLSARREAVVKGGSPSKPKTSASSSRVQISDIQIQKVSD